MMVGGAIYQDLDGKESVNATPAVTARNDTRDPRLFRPHLASASAINLRAGSRRAKDALGLFLHDERDWATLVAA